MVIKGTNTTTGERVYQLDGSMRLDFGVGFNRYSFPLETKYRTRSSRDWTVDWGRLVDEKEALDAVYKGIQYAVVLLDNPYENESFMEIAVNLENR